MIVLDKDRILDDYFIDENAVITDKNGNVQKQYLCRGRYYFKGQRVHKIMMNTFVGVRDRSWIVHHLDENKLNNKLSNLIYLTNAEHSRLHQIGKKNIKQVKKIVFGKHWQLSAETKDKMSASKIGKNIWTKNLKWFNDGVKNIFCKPDEVPDGFMKGMIRK